LSSGRKAELLVCRHTSIGLFIAIPQNVPKEHLLNHFHLFYQQSVPLEQKARAIISWRNQLFLWNNIKNLYFFSPNYRFA
jgi:hypothetical protein